MRIRKLAKRLPHFLKYGAKFMYTVAVPREIRFTKEFWDAYRFLQEGQWWGRAEIEDYQMSQLSKILNHAYRNVPYYRRAFDERGITPRDVQNLNDMKMLPFVTREDVQVNLRDLVARNFSVNRLNYVTTGGSSAMQIGFYNTGEQGYTESAFVAFLWSLAGFQVDAKVAVLRGDFIGSTSRPYRFHFEGLYRSLLLSSYRLSCDTYDLYKRRILDFEPAFFHAYPSSISMFADLVVENGDEGCFKSVKGILTASENLYQWQKDKLSVAFPNVRVFDFYGHAEKVILASMCEHTDQYHIWPFYGVTEILDKMNQTVAEGDAGELVGTSFWNYATPFIRYRTMDVARKERIGCPKCGRQLQLLERIEGRLHEFIVSRAGRYISMTAINMHDSIFDNVRQFQFYQDIPGRVVLRVVKKPTYSEDDTRRIYTGLKRKLGEDMDLEIQHTSEIPRTRLGKHRFLEQKLRLKYGE